MIFLLLFSVFPHSANRTLPYLYNKRLSEVISNTMEQRKFKLTQHTSWAVPHPPTAQRAEKSVSRQCGPSPRPRWATASSNSEMTTLTPSGSPMARSHISSTSSLWRRRGYRNSASSLISSRISHTLLPKYQCVQATTCKTSKKCSFCSSKSQLGGTQCPSKQSC